MTSLEPGTTNTVVTVYATTPATQFAANTHILLYVYPKFLFCPFLRNKIETLTPTLTLTGHK